ncbi:EAL domain-containing protein [Marinomonas ostreistagni]|uniref:sensor domain-containing phosphodiesterase n=1 Tax=Marinomonas ostreistagni TaxID=359209 RepID=UPI00194FE80D|nr:EAL domain-containing protein [Marinomonas ostreistagni]MBM6550796.1 EAL domain-containing protein [Marinomonas ostreistagni]
MTTEGTSSQQSQLFSNLINQLSSADAITSDAESQRDDIDTLVESIRQHLGMEIAFISRFKDGYREFTHINSHPECSLDIPVGHKDPSDTTYCQKICDKEIPAIIPNTQAHPITRNMAVTEALNIGSYIGVPITFSDDRVYGTLCCFSTTPDESLSHKDLSILTLFAQFASRNLEADLLKLEQSETTREAIFTLLQEEALGIALQPIYDSRKAAIVGYECLSRFRTDPYQPPNYWFAQAHEAGVGELLELYSIELSLALLNFIPEDRYLAINISPTFLNSQGLFDLLEHQPLERLVLEVTEREVIEDYAAFRESFAPLRAKGMRLAVDDAGAGFASFQHILELQADIIKLDRSLISNIDQDRSRRALVAALIGFAKETNCVVLGEGVEKQAEMHILEQLGVHVMQGYFFSRPVPPQEAIALTKEDLVNTAIGA